MKKIILIFILGVVAFSCTDSTKKSSLQELNGRKNTLVGKIDSLNNLLKNVENKISDLDTLKRLQIVTSIPVKKDTFKHFVEIQGVVKADKNIEIRPELGGTVNTIYVNKGQKVRAGQVLIQLDDSSIRNNMAELNTQLSLAKTTFERQSRLWNQKIGSEMQFLQAKAQKEGLENSLAALETQALKMRIIAPFSGIVDDIFPKKGELTNPTLPVVRLINLDEVYVEADVTETYLPVMKVGTETHVYFSSIQKEITSEISQIGNFINPDNRSFKTRINISNKDQTIKPNLLAELRILDFESEGIIIPSTLVQKDQEGADFVFTVKTVDNENIIVKKPILISKEYNYEIFVGTGLTETDILVNAGAKLVKAGDIVKISK